MIAHAIRAPFSHAPATEPGAVPTTEPRRVDASSSPAPALRRVDRSRVRRWPEPRARIERHRDRERLLVGADSDPYAASTEVLRSTRCFLGSLLKLEGRRIAIATRSSLVRRDARLLANLDRFHAVTVTMILPTVDDAVLERLEGEASKVESRLRAVATLAEEGLAVRVRCAPLIPGINASEDALRRLFERCVEAGAFDVVSGARHKPPGTGNRFQRWCHGLRHRGHLRWGAENDLEIQGLFQSLRLAHGMPRSTAGRG